MLAKNGVFKSDLKLSYNLVIALLHYLWILLNNNIISSNTVIVKFTQFNVLSAKCKYKFFELNLFGFFCPIRKGIPSRAD